MNKDNNSTKEKISDIYSLIETVESSINEYTGNINESTFDCEDDRFDDLYDTASEIDRIKDHIILRLLDLNDQYIKYKNIIN